MASFYAEDAIAYPPNEPAAVGRAAAEKVWAAYFADPTFSISWKTVHAGVSKSGDIGFTAGTYEDSFKGPDGKRVTEKGKYLCTWRKEKNGKWKAMADGTSVVRSFLASSNSFSYHTTFPPNAVSREFTCQVGAFKTILSTL